jgi:NADH-quinone oxidoreductase subunit J
MVVLTGAMLYLLHAKYFDTAGFAQLTSKPADYSNVKVLGRVLYTQYAYAFEVAGVLLVVAILSAIGLAFRGRHKGTKAQVIHEQMMAKKAERLKLVQGGFKKYD